MTCIGHLWQEVMSFSSKKGYPL